MRAALRGSRDLLMRSQAFQRAVRAGAVRGLLPRDFWVRLQPTGLWELHAPDGRAFLYESAPDDVLGRDIVWTDLHNWEEATIPHFHRLAQQARGFLDAGAYAGIYTLLACTANPALRAVAVEPNPASAAKLRRNIEINELNGRAQVAQKALSATPGRARLGIPERVTTASLAPARTPVASVEVEVTTADAAAAGVPIDLVKIDVEGLETEVLQGMTGIIAAYRPSIIAECLDRPALDKLRATAAELGYPYVHHLAPGGPVPAPEGFVPPPRHQNFLLTAEPPALV